MSVPPGSKGRGPAIVRFAKAHGMELDRWQSSTLGWFSRVDGDGRWLSPANLLLVPRQNGKTEILVARAMYGLFVLRKRMVLFSSHQWASSNEIFLRMKGIVEANDDLSEQVKAVKLSAAQLGFELHDGGRMLFLTRSRASARGFSGDELYFDEAHFLSEAAHAALRPTLGGRSAGGQVQTYYASSAVDQARHPDGLVVTRLRERGIKGEPGIALVEYAAGIVDEDGADVAPALVPAAVAVDPEVIRRANPGCPQRLSLEFLLDEARTLDPASFATEHLGQGDWPDLDGARSTVIDLDKWQALRDPTSKPLNPVVIGFDVSPDRRRASIAVAGHRLDGALHVEVVDNSEGVGWVVPRLRQLIDDHDPDGVWCDSSQQLLAEEVWREAGLRVSTLSRSELTQACGRFIDVVEQGNTRHLGDPVLLDAIRGATTAPAGGDGWVFSRRSSQIDISPLYATVFALFGVPDELASDGIGIY